MTTLSAEAAFAAYEAVRARLPAASPGAGPPRRAASLAELAGDYEVFLLDAFGVLNIGETAIPGVAERVAALRAQGRRVMVVSNAASVPVAALHAKYRAMGYDFAPEDIVTSRATLAASGDCAQAEHWGAMCPEGGALDDLGAARVTALGDDPAPFEAVDGFLLIGTAGWTEARQALLEAALAERARPVLVANPDIVAPREHGFTAEPGHYAHRLADRTAARPRFYGKPFPGIFRLALDRLGAGTDRSRVLMVGDSLHTDVLGAQAAGVASALVTGFGFFETLDPRAAIDRAGIVPDILLDRP